MDKNEKIEKRLKRLRTTSIICLIISLLLTGIVYANSFHYIDVKGNVIRFGKVDIDIGYYEGNTKKYYAKENKEMFDDLSTLSERKVEKEFFIENKGNLDAWYTMYLKFKNTDQNILMGNNLLVSIKTKDGKPIIPEEYEEPIKAIDFVKGNSDLNLEKIGSIEASGSKDFIICFERKNTKIMIEAYDPYDLEEMVDYRICDNNTDAIVEAVNDLKRKNPAVRENIVIKENYGTTFEFDFCVEGTQKRNNPKV